MAPKTNDQESRAKFIAGDIVYCAPHDSHYICAGAYLQDTNCMGEKRPVPLWDYLFYSLGGGAMASMPLDGDEETYECLTCRNQAFSLENLTLFLRTNVSTDEIEAAVLGE